VRDNQYSEQLAVSGLVARWSEVVGEQVAEHISVEDFRPAAGGSSGGTVVLRADSAAWTLQLKYLQDQILERITQEVGSGLVAAIEIRGPARQTPGGRLRVRHGRRSPRR
jgi:predicted nucleic acid-binding Zn ribbon protein